jgi:hypothetical protein
MRERTGVEVPVERLLFPLPWPAACEANVLVHNPRKVSQLTANINGKFVAVKAMKVRPEM